MLNPSLPWSLFLWCLALTVAGLVAIYRDFGRKRLAMALLAALLAGPFVTVISAEDDDFVLRNKCKELEPWSYQWVINSCWLFADDQTATTTTTRPAPRKPVK
jgi:hypothetical protein